MNPPSTIAKIRTLLLIAAFAVCPLVAFQTAANAQDVATATLTSGGMNSISIGPNGTFTLTLGVTTNFNCGGYTVFYQSNNGQGLFQIISITNLNPVFMLGDVPLPQLLNPSTMFDLGGASDQTILQPPGTFLLQSVQIEALNAPLGTYTIFLDNRSIMTSRTGGGFNDVNMGGPLGPMFTVQLIPEPATVGLLVMGGAVLVLAVARKRRAL